MVAADALAIGSAPCWERACPERAIRVFAAVAFVVFGVVLVAQLFRCRLMPSERRQRRQARLTTSGTNPRRTRDVLCLTARYS